MSIEFTKNIGFLVKKRFVRHIIKGQSFFIFKNHNNEYSLQRYPQGRRRNNFGKRQGGRRPSFRVKGGGGFVKNQYLRVIKNN